MANEIRVRANFVAGQLSSAMLTGDTTIQGAGLADLPAIGASEFAPIAIFRTDNAGRVTQKEIVWVTAHTAGATTATATRGREGTTAQAWNVGDRFSHTDTALDNTIVCTSATRPATPFEGLEIYERDTLRKMMWNGAAWVETWARQHSWKGIRTSVQNTSAGWNMIVFNGEVWDESNAYNPANGWYNAPEAGLYEVDASLEVRQATTGAQRWVAGVWVEGVENNEGLRGIGMTRIGGSVGDFHNIGVNGLVRCNAGNSISIRLYDSNGGTPGIQGHPDLCWTWAMIRRVGPKP